MKTSKSTSPFLEGSEEIIPCGSACEALSFLQQIYHSAPVGMAAIGPDLKIIRVNQRLADFAGMDSVDCPGLPLEKFLPQASDLIKDLIAPVVNQQKTVLNHELCFATARGQVFWSASAYPVTYESNNTLSVNLIIHDITELRKTQISLEKAHQDILNLQEKLKLENQVLKSELAHPAGDRIMVGSSKALQNVLYQIHKVAPTDATVLITGETGTGKELAAREIHRCSRRAEQPLIVVNCAALPANLIESELFGHEKGSFTGAIARKIGRFEVASGGTIFLDEIGEMPLELQSKLLRVLQENQLERIGSTRLINIDVRVIAATNRDLKAEVERRRFREDLFFRLHVFPVHLPALRERDGDVIEIASEFIHQCARKQGKAIKHLSQESIARLQTYNWPGNIRELRNLVERAVILCQSDTLEIDVPKTAATGHSSPVSADRQTQQNLNDVEKTHILQVLESTSWRIRGVRGAAELLGMKPTTLESRMVRLGIRRKSAR